MSGRRRKKLDATPGAVLELPDSYSGQRTSVADASGERSTYKRGKRGTSTRPPAISACADGEADPGAPPRPRRASVRPRSSAIQPLSGPAQPVLQSAIQRSASLRMRWERKG